MRTNSKSRKFRLSRQWRRSLVAVVGCAAAIVLWACGGGSAIGSSKLATTSISPDVTSAASYSIAPYVTGADGAVAMTFDTRGRLLYNEKDSGRIVRFANGRKTVLATLGVAGAGGGSEAGLLGLTVDKRGEVYAYYTSTSPSCPDPTTVVSGGGIQGHCVWAFKPTSSGLLRPDHLVFSADHPSTTENHVGGGLHIGPDGALYLSIGDLGENDTHPNNGPTRAQDLSLPFGKMLRLEPAATNQAAAGNPGHCGNADNSVARNTADTRIFACGLRNSFAFAFDMRGRIWASEAGDDCDEINLIKAGVNYGWQPPRTQCAGSGAGAPVLKITGTPSGLTVPTSKAAGSWRNDVLYCLYEGGALMRYDQRTRKVSPVSKAAGKCEYNLAARGRYVYMSSTDTIYRIRIGR